MLNVGGVYVPHDESTNGGQMNMLLFFFECLLQIYLATLYGHGYSRREVQQVVR